MPRRITVTFADGSQHIYENAPDDVTPQQVVDRATKEFRKPVKGLDGGRGVIEHTARAVGGIASGIYDAADKAMQPVRDAVGYDPKAAEQSRQATADRINQRRADDLAKQDGFVDRVGDLFQKGEAAFDAGMFRLGGDSRLARGAEATANRQLQGEVTWEEAKGDWLKLPQFVAEQGIVSLPSMAAAAAGAPGVLAAAGSNTGQIAQSRAEGDGRTDASGGDIAFAAPFGAASALLDLKGIDSILKAEGKNAFTRIVKAGAAEGLTEALQSAIEYTGGAAGTNKGFSAGEMLDQALQGGLVGAGVGSGIRATGESGRGTLAGARKVFRLGGNVMQRPLAPGKIYESVVNTRVTPEDQASPIPTDLIQEGKASIAASEATASADSILRAAGMPATGTRVNVRMPDGTVRAGTMADAFMTDAGDMGIAAGLAVNLDDGSIFAEHFDTLNDAGVTITPVDPVAAANAAFDEVVNSAAQAGGFAAPGSGLLNPPALPAPADQAEQPKGMRGTPVKNAKAAIEAVYPGVRVTSWTRGADSVGSPTSWHKRSRAAVDVAPIKGMTFDEFIGGLKAKGYSIIEAIDEVKNPSKWATGPHWHVVLGEGGSQQAGPRATSAPIGGEFVQDDMFGGPSLTEGQIAARDNVGRVLDEAVAEDDTFDLRKAARELEAARVDFEASGQGKFSDYVDPMSDIPGSLRQAIDANPNLLPLVLKRAGIEDAAANVAAPTEAQKEAGNYRKGHVRLHGLDITIETPRGAERSGTDPSGKKWSVSMPDHYGYVKRTEGADGEQVDVYVGPNPESTRVFLIDQNDADTGKFDEHKAMLGYRSSVDAIDAYNAAFDDGRGPERMGNVVEMSAAEFREWLKQPRTAPAAETMPQGTTGTGAEAPAAQPSSNPEQLPAAPEEGPLSTETMPGAGPRNKLVLRTHKVDGGYRVDGDYEIGGFSGGYGVSGTGATPEAARAALVERLARQLDPNTFGSAATDQHRSAATKMLKWLRRGEGPAEGTTSIPGFAGWNPERIASEQNVDVLGRFVSKSAERLSALEADIAEQVRNGADDADVVDLRRAAQDVRALANMAIDRQDELAAAGKGTPARFPGQERPAQAQRPTQSELSRQVWQEMFDEAGVRLRERLDAVNPEALRPMLEAMAERGMEMRDGDMIDMPNPHRAVELGYIEINVDEKGYRKGVITQAGRDFVSGKNAAAPKPSKFAGNKVFTEDRVAAARARLKDKLNRLNSGIDPELLMDGIVLAGAHIEAGVRRFADLARTLADDLGSDLATLKPYLRAWYNGARDMLEDAGEDVSDMDGPGAVKAAMTMIEDQATQPAKSAISPTETSNADNAERGQTETDDRGSAQGARSEGLPAGEGERDAGRDSGEQGRGGAADLPADDAGRGEQDREPVNPERPAAGGGKRKSGGSRNGDSAGNRVRRDKPARSDGGVNYFAPVGSLKREGGWKTTATRNLDIIELINRLTAENRQATPEEQALLAKWTGWGAGEIRNNLFRTVKRLPGGGRAIVPPAFGEWKDVGERAARLLQGDALETALQSTQYAHYTSEGVIRSIWKGLERLGFTGGKILEPGMGSGLFAIAAPKGIMDQSSYTGIEMDAFTAKVAGYLLPAENVIAADFVKQKLPNGFFDVAIGNPPFANIQVTDDPAYRRYRFSLHDYFFAKSIDKVRPGGIMVFVTSRYTMDKLDRKAREYIAERADLLGAVRLPQTAFKENAGTEVVTDVLFFQRRAPGTEMGGKDWLASEPIKIGAEDVAINTYYVQHPEMVLGKHATTGSMYRKNEYTVEPLEGDIEEAFAKVISKLPQGVFLEAAPEAAQTAERKTFEADMIPAAEKEGGLYLKNGVLHVRQDGIGVALESTANLNGKEKVWLADYVPLRDAVKQAQRDQLQDGPWEKSLAALNKLYDAFVKKHGPISAFTQNERTDQVTADEGEPGAYFDKKEGEWVKDVTRVTKRFTNRRRLRFDVESTLVEALEKISDDGKISKGPFLLGRTIDKPKRGKVESASDAVAVTLDEIGRFDPDYAAQLRGVPVTDLLKELGDEVYQAPDGTWTLADEYLSGDVVAKLEEAQTAAANDPRFERNVTALIKVQPKPLAYADISVRLGAGWIEPKVIEQFAEEVLEDPVDGLHYEPATGIWTVPESRRRTGRSASSEYATEDRSARELLDAVLNNRTIKITRKDSDKKTYTDQEATALANERAKKIGEKFRSWIWTDANRAQRLAAKYNRLFNNLAPRKFDGSHLTFPGLSTRYKLYDHQRRAIWRVIATGNTYLNHAVGAGKTLEMIVSAMEQRRLGLVRKPMFVVPNHMLNQFAREFLDAYPAANLMVADEHAFQTENRRRFMAKAALNDPDAIIVPHSSLVKIGTLEATRQAVIDRFIGELEEAMNALDGDSARHARKNIENQIERIKRQFAGKADTETKDRALTFEEMGVDFLYVDEAHEFRKLDFATNRTSVKGIDSNGSKRALDLYIKLLWLNEQRPGRAAVLASGTPVTNTMAEIYTVMRYMDQTGLERDGLAAFDAWAANFGEVVPGFEQNAAGGYEIVERFSKFVNVPELMKRVRTFMDVLTSPQLGDLVKRPDVKGGGPQNVVAKPSDELNAYMKGELATRIQVSRKFKPSKDQPNNPDPLINIITDGRLSAIDMRFVDNTAPNDPGSKLNLMIDRIIENARAYRSIEYTDPKTGQKLPRKGATQIVFSAVGFGDQVAKNRGFDARAWVDKRLIDAGLSPSEIAWMSDQNTHAKKEATFKAMRNAEITTLLGSPKNMGTGVNVQARLKALHFLSPPWYPSDVEQPHGRIIRQGNMNPEVEIYWYATKGTYDSTAWQMVSRKAKFIEQAMSGDETIRSIEDISEANQYEMASALAAGDERAIQLAGLSGDIERLTKLRAAHADEQTSLRWESKRLERAIASQMQQSANYAAAAEARGEMGPFAVRVDGISYDRPGEAGAAMIAAIDKELEAFDGGDLKSVEIGRYRDNLPVNLTIEMRPLDGAMKRYFDLTVQAGPVELAIVEERRSTDTLDAVGISQRIQNALRGIDAERRELQMAMEQTRSEQAKVSRKLGAPFEYEADLAERVAERARLEGELAAETAAAQKAIDEAAKVKEDAVLYEAIAEDGGQEYNGTDDDPTDPDGPGSGRRAEPADMPGDGAVLRSRGPVLRGLGIAERFERHGATALVGETVTSERDLAEIAQIYRDPRHETLRVFFTKGDKIVHSTAVSSRSASSSPLMVGNLSIDHFTRWLGETMRSSGADGYYLLHNHPTGIPEPSRQDRAMTRTVASAAFGFRGHVIINSNKFGQIDWMGNGQVLDLPARPDTLLTPSKPNPILGQNVQGGALLARLAKDVQLDQGNYFTLVLASARLDVRAVVDVPRTMLDRPDIILFGALRKHLRLSGSENVFLIGTTSDLSNVNVRRALRAGVLTAAFNENGIITTGAVSQLPDFLLGGKANAVAEERTAFENEETERRFQEAKAGLATTQTFRERVSEAWERAWNGITRHWIALPNEARYAALQEKLRAIEAAPQSARERTIRLLDDMVKDFTDADLDLFTRKVILDDLSWDAANDRDLPFGFTPETLRAEKAKIDQLVKDQPEQRVHKAVMKRKLVNRKIAQELVDAGVLEAEQIKNPAYYRHQVLEYARAQAQYARTPGKKLRTPKWAKRMGSTLDINANLLEAEFDWLNKALLDIPVARTIEWIGKSEHNILDRLKKQAKDSNDEGVRRELTKAREVLDENESGPEVEAAMLLIEQEKGFRQYIAMGFEHVRTALENDEIKVPARFAKAAAAIESGKGSTSEPPFAFLSWLLNSDEPGAMGAAMIMKAISQRRVWTKKLLGRDYIDPQDANALVKSLAPEGYRTWQPDEGKLLFTVKTLPEHVIDGMIEKLESADGIDPSAFRGALEGARNALAMGGDRYTMILPEEVADTLSNLRREELDSLFDHFIKEPVKLWKRWVLINPRRFFKYNLNNTSGDLDAVIAGNPRSLRRIGEAGRELAQVMTGRAKASARYEEAVARGVFDSGLSVQEIPDIHKLEPFERFAKKPGPINKVTILPLRKAWAALQGATQWRENVMRYAAYLDYVERIEAGESQKSIGYGASRPDMVDAVVDPKDRAALLARDLLGDYGAISHYGGWLRQTIIPFWSWTEINTKRYWRLTANAYSEGIGKGVATGGALAIAQGARTTAWLALRMALLYGLFSLWNKLFFPDEEDELGDAQQAQMHVILGRNSEGEIITIRAQGALSDALSWFGLGDIAKAARNYELGRGSLVDVIDPLWQTPVNKMATSLTPVITVPMEAVTGKKLWPNVFKPRNIPDRWRNTFQALSFENEYDAFLDMPTRGYGRSWQEAVIYRRDPGEDAYNQGRAIAYAWIDRTKGETEPGRSDTPKARAASDYRLALKYGDKDAATKAIAAMAEAGMTQGEYRAMMKRAAPLGPIAKKDRAAFVAQLTDDERATMIRAQEWYNATFLGR